MKLRRILRLVALAAVLMLLRLPVCAANVGSLQITKAKEPVLVYAVADATGVATTEFAPKLTQTLSQEQLTPALARELFDYAKENQLQAKQLQPENSVTTCENLELGYYLVCSTVTPGEFAPFLIGIPMTIGDKAVYDIHAEPKVGTGDRPSQPAEPIQPQPNIPQTGNILWPKYLLLTLGAVAILAGFVQVLRGREDAYE